MSHLLSIKIRVIQSNLVNLKSRGGGGGGLEICLMQALNCMLNANSCC